MDDVVEVSDTDLGRTLGLLEPHREELVAVAVESTFNWYWLVDGLMGKGYVVRLVNTSAVRQYEGLKYADDKHDARWLAHLMRLGRCGTCCGSEDGSRRSLHAALPLRAEKVCPSTPEPLMCGTSSAAPRAPA